MPRPDIAPAAAALVEDGIRRSIAGLARLLEEEFVLSVVRTAEVIAASLHAGGKLLVFGNGGSAADAQHIAAELIGRFMVERQALPAIALADNSAAMTAIANDYRYEDVFSRQISALGAPGDVALAISTSGESPNVLCALATAAERGMRTVGLTGGTGGALAEAVEICLTVPGDSTARIQEGHILVAHLVCELVERESVTW